MRASTIIITDAHMIPTRTPLAGAVAAYVDYVHTVKTKASAQVDSWYIRNLFRLDGPGFGLSFEHVEDINSVEVNALLLRLRRVRGLAPKTVNRGREVLCRFCNWCVKYKGVCFPRGRNPIMDVERQRENAPVIRFLQHAEIRVQLERLIGDLRLRTMVAVLIYAGLRRSELLWLTPDDVDLTPSARIVPDGSKKAVGHGMLRIRAKRVSGEFWQPKTAINRSVPVSSALRGHLKEYEGHFGRSGPWYFPTVSGARYDENNFSRKLRNANIAAGLKWSSLDFRHTFGSLLAMKGESLYKISTLMGNSPEICRRHYAALLPESLIDTVEF